MTVLILAAGAQTRWAKDGNPIRTQKQLLQVCGDPIIARTVKLCRRYMQVPIVVTRDPEIVKASGTSSNLNPDDNGTVLRTLYSTKHTWDIMTTVLLGDVIYSPWAMATIAAGAGPVTFYGRDHLPGRPLGKYHEIFALKFNQAAVEGLVASLKHAMNIGDDWGKLRTLYEVMAGIPLKSFQTEREYFYPIGDWTEDIDCIEDWVIFQSMALDHGMCREVL